MFTKLFERKPLIDQDTRQWLFDCASWAILHFDKAYFIKSTQLILPTNNFYPGKVASVEQMADAIFCNTKTYAGLAHWPLKLIPFNQKSQQLLPQLSVQQHYRSQQLLPTLQNDATYIEVGYVPQQINQPQDMIATYVQQLANIMVYSAKILPPGGKAMLPQAIEVLSCFLGFGVMFANTAYQFKGGCGSCYNAQANRQVALPENDILYALAIFSVVKHVPAKQVVPHLKNHLRGTYKKMRKEVETLQNNDEKYFLSIA